MGTYRKMIVRDLGGFPIPDKIQRKIHKAGLANKKGAPGAVIPHAFNTRDGFLSMCPSS